MGQGNNKDDLIQRKKHNFSSCGCGTWCRWKVPGLSGFSQGTDPTASLTMSKLNLKHAILSKWKNPEIFWERILYISCQLLINIWSVLFGDPGNIFSWASEPYQKCPNLASQTISYASNGSFPLLAERMEICSWKQYAQPQGMNYD